MATFSGCSRSRLGRSQNTQLFEQVSRPAELIGNKQNITYVDRDGSTLFSVIEKVIAEAFVIAIKDDPDLLATSVQNGTAGVAADDVRIGKKIDGYI